MKSIYTYLAAAAVITLFSCQSDLEDKRSLEYDSYNFASDDAHAGEWDMIIVADHDQVLIPEPALPGSATVQAELEEVKTAIKNASSKQLESVAYWTNNPAVRWNEIAVELAAKYNLIPAPNSDGTYPAPDPANPSIYPLFPFTNPPYTSRALAYMSVAQYDGSILAWHYKKEFQRPAPHDLDSEIKPMYQTTALGSYPSEGAVIAITSKTILTAMFPLEKDYLEKLAEEHLESLIISGTNLKSDVEAGVYIGTEVSKLTMARAANDGMKGAQGTKAQSDSMKVSAQERFGWHWENMESPPRPMGLVPMFWKVKTWNIQNLADVRADVPPKPGSLDFMRDVDELNRIAKKMTKEQRAIANYWNDGLGSYTPPGHWNRKAKEVIIKHQVNPVRTARIFAYMNMAIMDAGISCWDTKYYYHYPRPIQTVAGFRTILGTPNFPSYTSGHSMFSAAAAEVLAYFFPQDAQMLTDWAKEAAESRIYGGIHYRFDAEAGLESGSKVGVLAIERAKKDQAE